MFRAEVVPEFVRGDKAVRRYALVALGQPRAVARLAQDVKVGNAGDPAFEVPAREEKRQPAATLFLGGEPVVGELDKQFVRNRAGERVVRLGKDLDKVDRDLDAELLAEDAVDVVHAGQHIRFRIGACAAREFVVRHHADLEFVHSTRRLGERGVEFARDARVGRGKSGFLRVTGSAAHHARFDVGVLEPVDRGVAGAGQLVNREHFRTVPDEAGRHAVGDDDADPRTGLAGKAATI